MGCGPSSVMVEITDDEEEDIITEEIDCSVPDTANVRPPSTVISELSTTGKRSVTWSEDLIIDAELENVSKKEISDDESEDDVMLEEPEIGITQNIEEMVDRARGNLENLPPM